MRPRRDSTLDLELYDRREQSAAKHLILGQYLELLALKVGQFRTGLTLNYIDGFSGPWESKAADLSDTSPALALQRLLAVRETLTARGGSITVRAFFVSLTAEGAEKLRTLQGLYPAAEIEVVTGTLESRIEDARRFVRTGHAPFGFLFIDPTGWTGFGMHAISPLLRECHRSEVLLNFMTGHIGRFVDSDDANLVPSFVDLFGDASYRDEWRDLSGLDREERMVEAYCQRLAQAGGYRHCVSNVILNPGADRTHYHIVYGTHSDEGLVAFRGVESEALRLQRAERANARQRQRVQRSGQAELFGGQQLVTRSYEDELRDRYLPRASIRLDAMLRAREAVSWDDLLIDALRVPMVNEDDVKRWLDDRRAQGIVEVLGLRARERIPKRKAGHWIRRIE